MYFPLDGNRLVKSRTRFGLLGLFAETENQWMTFRFGCIGNYAIRNAESFSDEWSSESAPRVSGTENTRTSFVRLANICGENTRHFDSSWRQRRLVIPCSFSGVKLTLCDIRALPSSTLSSNYSLRNCRRPSDYLDANS